LGGAIDLEIGREKQAFALPRHPLQALPVAVALHSESHTGFDRADQSLVVGHAALCYNTSIEGSEGYERLDRKRWSERLSQA
jgi:hypothetical protein